MILSNIYKKLKKKLAIYKTKKNKEGPMQKNYKMT